MGIRDFIETNYSHFNAGELARCIDSLREFLDGGGRLMITLAGAMSTAEIGKEPSPRNQISESACNLLHRSKSGRGVIRPLL